MANGRLDAAADSTTLDRKSWLSGHCGEGQVPHRLAQAGQAVNHLELSQECDWRTMLSYTPRPIDTSTTTLAPELSALTERLAEHAHDIWAQQRLTDGWKHGPKRDDSAKEHPCLVPYAQLPETEKQYDRQMAIGTLKAIVALGYRIAKP